MQLIKKSKEANLITKPSLTSALAIATGSLLNISAASAETAPQWELDIGTLLYQESDSRVRALATPVINITRMFEDESTVNFKMTFDSLSGASPYGAAIANVAQTFTSPSALAASTQTNASGVTGNTDYDDDDDYDSDDDNEGAYISPSSTSSSEVAPGHTVPAGELPLDESFEDSRQSYSLNWSQPLKDNATMNLGGSFSLESDFTSLAVNGALAKEFNQKNTSASIGFNLEFDTVNPHGGIQKALGVYGQDSAIAKSDNKQVGDLVFGISQVMNRRWLMSMNLSFSYANGYQSDAYKILSVVDQGNLVSDPNDGTKYLYLYENRPEARLKISTFMRHKFAIGSDDSVEFSHRYMTDDWGVNSNTIDFTYHFKINDHLYVEPHYRYYNQSAADFYTPFLELNSDVSINGTEVTANRYFASSDQRLAAFSAATYGLKIGIPIDKNSELSLRVEQYQQQDQNSRKAVGAGSNLDGMSQFSELSAQWVQLGYKARW